MEGPLRVAPLKERDEPPLNDRIERSPPPLNERDEPPLNDRIERSPPPLNARCEPPLNDRDEWPDDMPRDDDPPPPLPEWPPLPERPPPSPPERPPPPRSPRSATAAPLASDRASKPATIKRTGILVKYMLDASRFGGQIHSPSCLLNRTLDLTRRGTTYFDPSPLE